MDRIFFPRCAKVGSESLVEFMDDLQDVNNFEVDHVGMMKNGPRILTPKQQSKRARYIFNQAPGTVYIEHTAWIDFHQYNLPKPIFINLVRDPVERMISWYYYVRNSYLNAIFYHKHPTATIKPVAWYKKNFNDCVRNGDAECQYVPGTVKDYVGNYKRQSLFFCGHDRDCLPFDSPLAIQIAKRRVEEEYAVVGTWEETNITLTVLEHYIPRYFARATKLYPLYQKSLQNRNRNNRKPKVDADVKAMIRLNVTTLRLNNTRLARRRVVFFNRPTRVGTELMLPLLTLLSKHNDVNLVLKGPVRKRTRMRTAKQERIETRFVSRLEKDSLYVAHGNWIDFAEYNRRKPIYISLVRDPVERMIDNYYQQRTLKKKIISRNVYAAYPQHPDAWYRQSFNECVRRASPECQYIEYSMRDEVEDFKRQSLFFCGNDIDCLPFNTRYGVQKAKRNVEKEYSVVGTWEQPNITLTVLEKYVPRYFNHARTLFNLHKQSYSKRFRRYAVDADVWAMMATLNVRDLNNTRKAQMELVFFNRVPKVGSQTFMELLRRLSERNNFQFHRDAVQKVETIRLAEDQQQEMAEVISELPEPSVFIKHVCFTNFTKFNLPTPIYLNVVRDPVERVISWFYYVRAPWYFVERKAAFPDLPLPHPAWLKKDFETCVLSGDQECTYTQGVTVEGIGDHRRQSLFFCGHDYECTPFNTVGALERAKFAVEQQYAVVGVLEDFNTTLSVLEKYVPRFFEGVRDIYATSAEYLTKINKNNFKPPVSEHVKDIVRRNFTNEIEFYQFCRQRLHKQYLAAHLPQRIVTAHSEALERN
ncbi:hypothetical protein AWZ03_009570 [Drosophila navojoa]|uniref:Sulfotransferase domain-containing protein n=2 Tax=Drosophila navojoa TaxID=7232 RepID=A0A484B842_DRONA|nr:hypothetical protein AWZ03_009570 [Drosophila navojoa]